ncbi:MAG: hypothetical protein EZS28_036591 [Streblomastix strix]|uniref:Uncharacterized protein n=1 Tax=Streblomastix strix TaxID=222440 RepID=A0A5J4UDC9_9EUKA|nr:MAG: hypothetical protein EZS28_036591 [Streblomastix strix]
MLRQIETTKMHQERSEHVKLYLGKTDKFIQKEGKTAGFQLLRVVKNFHLNKTLRYLQPHSKACQKRQD